MVYKRRKYHYGDTHLKKKWRTKRRTKDLDEVFIRGFCISKFLLHCMLLFEMLHNCCVKKSNL